MRVINYSMKAFIKTKNIKSRSKCFKLDVGQVHYYDSFIYSLISNASNETIMEILKEALLNASYHRLALTRVTVPYDRIKLQLEPNIRKV